MSGSKSKSTSVSYSGSAQPWATPIATDQANEAISVYQANKPVLAQQIADNNTLGSRLNADYQSAGQMGAGANDYFNKVLSGSYLKGNPFLQGVIDAGAKDITNNVNSQFTQAGRYGSGAHTDVLASALAELENQLRYQDYATERGYQQDAAQGSLSVEQARQQAQQAAVQQLLQQQAVAAELPYTGINNLASALGTLFNGGNNTSTSTQKSSVLGNLIDAIGTVGAAAI